MSFVKSEKQNDMIEEVSSMKEKAVLGNKRSKNDLNIQMTKTPDFNRSISLQSSKKRDQKAMNEGQSNNSRGGVTSIADIAFATLNNAKKAGLKGNARTLIWIHSLREKAAAVESMLHKLQSLTIALKRKQQLGGCSKRNDYSAIAVATAIAGGGSVMSKPANTTSFSSSIESSSTSTKSSSGNDGGSVPAVSEVGSDLTQNEESDIKFDTSLIAQQINELEETVKAMRATLFLVCRGRLLEKQIGLLLSIQNQMYPTFDISVRFFGIDWPHLFRISQGLIQRVEQLSETLLGTKLESLPPASGTTNVLSQGDTTSSSKTSESAKKKLSKLSKLPASDAIKSTNDTLPKVDKKESSSVRPLLRLSSSKSEPHMTQKRAWPAATTVLAQAASSGKAKNRYIDILIPSNILRDLATIEADVTAHLEAVLRERLSKIHRERILKEQRGFESRNTSRRSTARGTKSAGGRFSFHPFNHIRITPGASTNSTPKKTDIAPAGSENNVIDGIKPEENGISLEASLASSLGKTPKLVHSKSTGNLLGGKMRRIKEVLSFGSNRGLHGRHLNNETLWGAWYSGLQTVAFMPPQVPNGDNHPNSLPLSSVRSNQPHSNLLQRNNFHGGCDDSLLETDSQTDGSSCGVRNSKMRGARPKSSHYRHYIQTLPDSSASTPFHYSTSTAVSRSPSRKRGKSCDRLDNGYETSSTDAHTKAKSRMPKMIQQHEVICHDTSVSFDSTCTEETTSSSGGGADSRNHHYSGQRILPARHNQSHGGKRQQQQEDSNIFNEFLEERLDSGVSSCPKEDLPMDERSQYQSQIPKSTSSDVGGVVEASIHFKPSKELGKRGKLQRSVRVTDDEFTPRKKTKEKAKKEESFDLDTEDDDNENIVPLDRHATPSRFVLENTDGVTIKSFRKGFYSSVSPGSFDGLDDDEGDVAYIDDDVDERDLHGDLLNWLTLSDAPRQGHDEHDL